MSESSCSGSFKQSKAKMWRRSLRHVPWEWSCLLDMPSGMILPTWRRNLKTCWMSLLAKNMSYIFCTHCQLLFLKELTYVYIYNHVYIHIHVFHTYTHMYIYIYENVYVSGNFPGKKRIVPAVHTPRLRNCDDDQLSDVASQCSRKVRVQKHTRVAYHPPKTIKVPMGRWCA